MKDIARPVENGNAVPTSEAGSVSLFDWQEQAVQAWLRGDSTGAHRGTLEIFTGGGKTVISLSAFLRIREKDPSAKLAIVVPTQALALQWVEAVKRQLGFGAADVGLLGAGKSDQLRDKQVLVAVLNSAAKYLPEQSSGESSLMLVVDECHRAGAKTFSRVLESKAKYRMGLSATPARDETDDEGLPLSFEQQSVGQLLGEIVFQFGLKEARERGWLPEYVVHHHGVSLTSEERREYDMLSDRVTDASDNLESLGVQSSAAWFQARRPGEKGDAARAYVGAVAARKDLLYRASDRLRVAKQLVSKIAELTISPRVLVFHERVSEVEKLHEMLHVALPHLHIALEHSDLPIPKRRTALAEFRSGKAQVLVSVKSLVEGIDVPDADVGVSVASSSSVRQRIQTLGRVLRRRFDGGVKTAEMHVLYASDTVDELIYGKEDWSDLTGEAANRYWKWSADPEAQPQLLDGPPRKPRPTEEQEWSRFEQTVPPEPAEWLGEIPSLEFSVDTKGNATTLSGGAIENAQGVSQMITRVRGRPGGRFRVTPIHRLVIVFGRKDDRMIPMLAGQLGEPLRLQPEQERSTGPIDAKALKPGDPYPGPTDRVGGEYKIRQLRGGVIERRAGTSSLFAGMSEPSNVRHSNARRVLESWRTLNTNGFRFALNSQEHAWYREAGATKFLAEVPGGFDFPEKAPDTEKSSGNEQSTNDGENAV